jgi:hypothetical protein
MKFKYKFRYAILGGHAHVQLFVGGKYGSTLARAGSFVLNSDEFEEFKAMLSAHQTVEFVESDGRSDT